MFDSLNMFKYMSSCFLNRLKIRIASFESDRFWAATLIATSKKSTKLIKRERNNDNLVKNDLK